MARFTPDMETRALAVIELYPERRSATIPLCHLAQEQDGYLTREAMEQISELVGITPAEVLGTASFYDMLHTEPVGKYLVGVCTNIACLLKGGEELLEHAEQALGVAPGGTTDDGMFTLEEMECIAHCDKAPAVQVNYRFFGPLGDESFDSLVEELRGGALDAVVPPHGTLSRVHRTSGIAVPLAEIIEARRSGDLLEAERARAKAEAEGAGGNQL
ncbi:MAG: NAD(P)H-dependent oxidoreductase subunit E [Acidimicrobiaceae bacterium]|nr:NAD(P)H-dependent oxidoreductase subunit E [Acidimicrobiaceae bacterium]